MKKTTQTAPSADVSDDINLDVLGQLGQLIKKYGARVPVVDWATVLMNNAENVVGVTGDELLNRTIEISEAARKGKVVKHEKHFTIYANQVRDELLASKKVQRRALPIVVNLTKMAVSFLLKEPVSKDSAQALIDPVAQEIVPRLANMLASYLQRLVKTDETVGVLYETDFATLLEQPIKKAYAKYLDEHWDALTHGK